MKHYAMHTITRFFPFIRSLSLHKHHLLSVLFSVLSLTVLAQGKHTISGSVRDKASGESIIRATVVVADQNIGVTTNDYGFYSLTLPDGEYPLIISAVGRQPQTITITLKENMQLP